LVVVLLQTVTMLITAQKEMVVLVLAVYLE
jgi:hypothetical protein